MWSSRVSERGRTLGSLKPEPSKWAPVQNGSCTVGGDVCLRQQAAVCLPVVGALGGTSIETLAFTSLPVAVIL